MVEDRYKLCHIVFGYIEACFYGQIPVGSAEGSELAYKAAIKQGFTSAEGYSSACSEEIEFVFFSLLIELFDCHSMPVVAFFEALRVDAILAAEGARAEAGEGYDSVAVEVDTMAGYCYEGCLEHNEVLLFCVGLRNIIWCRKDYCSFFLSITKGFMVLSGLTRCGLNSEFLSTTKGLIGGRRVSSHGLSPPSGLVTELSKSGEYGGVQESCLLQPVSANVRHKTAGKKNFFILQFG